MPFAECNTASLMRMGVANEQRIKNEALTNLIACALHQLLCLLEQKHIAALAIAAAEKMQRTIAELQESLMESAVGMAFGWQECERHLAAAQRLVRQGASVEEVMAEQAAAVRAFGGAVTTRIPRSWASAARVPSSSARTLSCTASASASSTGNRSTSSGSASSSLVPSGRYVRAAN